jgi:3-deoxy-D-manno-octulosonic acid kinase
LAAFSQLSLNGYEIGAKRPITPVQASQLLTALRIQPPPADPLLGGRRSAWRIHLKGIGPVMVKHYHRGGLLAKFISRYYLRTTKTRGQREFEQMELARSVGVEAPEPVAYAYRGRIFYRAWLITREIENSQSMAQLSRTAPHRTADAMAVLCHQTRLLIKHHIMHADFHPGNVLVDEDNRVYLIDFDKTGVCRRNHAQLALKYSQRWCRAVHKHGLPPMLCTRLDLGTPGD